MPPGVHWVLLDAFADDWPIFNPKIMPAFAMVEKPMRNHDRCPFLPPPSGDPAFAYSFSDAASKLARLVENQERRLRMMARAIVDARL